MKEEKLGYSVHIHGELEKAISCPVGDYYVDVENEMFYFEPKDGLDPKPAEMAAMLVSVIGGAKNIETAKAVMNLHENFARIKPEHIKKEDDKRFYDFYVQGDLSPAVSEETLGTLYGDFEREVYFFDPKHKGFMAPILKKKFFEGIKKDLKNEDPEIRSAAVAVQEIYKNWTELDEEDIVR